MPTMKDGIDASAHWYTAVEDVKYDINVSLNVFNRGRRASDRKGLLT